MIYNGIVSWSDISKREGNFAGKLGDTPIMKLE
jgi:hypothetical protein